MDQQTRQFLDGAVNQIQELFTKIRAELEESGLSGTNCTYKREKLEEATVLELNQAYCWLLGFEAGFIIPYKKACGLVPKIVWDMYALHGKGKTYEERERKDRLKMMWDEWKQRPHLLRKSNVEDSGTEDPKLGTKDNQARSKRS